MLPEEYQQVEWIEGTGTQYIITNVSSGTKTRYETSISYTDVTNRGLCGASGGVYYGVVNGKFQVGHNGTDTSNITASINTWYDLIFENDNDNYSLSVNGSTATNTKTTTYAAIGIFKLGTTGSTPTNVEKCKRKYFRVYQAGVLVLNCIPCYRKSDNVIGMYDTVNSVFYTNDGTGTFNKGANVTQGNILGQSGGGAKINGIINEYQVAAGENISAGDFVEFVKQYASTNSTKLNNNSDSASAVSAVALDENTVFIAHSLLNSYYYVYGVVCTINDTTITVGTETLIGTTGGSSISAVLVNDNKVFVSYINNDSGYLVGVICTINDTTITVGTETTLSNYNGYSCRAISAIKINETSVFVAYIGYMSGTYGGYYTFGVVCTINGTTITVGTETIFTTKSYTYGSLSATLVDDNKVFVTYSGNYSNSYYYLYATVCTISGTTITKGNEQTILTPSDYYQGLKVSAVTLSKASVFVGYLLTSNYYVYGVVCTINGTSITVGTKIQISSTLGGGGSDNIGLSVIKLTSNELFIAYNSNTNKLYGNICIALGTIEVGTETLLNDSNLGYGGQISAVLGESVFIAFSNGEGNLNNYYLYGMIAVKNLIKSYNSNISGVAKTNGTGGDTIKVYEPELS